MMTANQCKNSGKTGPYVLSTYPLSLKYRKKIEEAIPPPSYLSTVELRQLGAWGALKKLLSLSVDHLYIGLEDEGSRVALSILQIMAGITPARSIRVITSKMEQFPVPRRQIAQVFLQFVWASIRNYAATLRSKPEVAALLRLPRLSAAGGEGQKVLYLNANLWFGLNAGGAVGHIAGVANALSQAGHSVTYSSSWDNPMLSPTVQRFPLRPPICFGLPQDCNFYKFNFQAKRQIMEGFGNRNFNFLYQRMSIHNYTGVQLSRAWGMPLILEYNGSEAWVAKTWRGKWVFQKLAEDVEKVCLRHAHLVVTVSEVLADELLQFGVDQERIVCYPNCIDPATFDPARFAPDYLSSVREKLGIPPDAVVFTFLGTFSKWHGAEVFAEAIRILAVTDSAWLEANKVRFVFIGDGVRMSFVEKILADPRCHRFCTLMGLVEQAMAPNYLAASDVLLSPHVASDDGSKFFGSPTKLFEYMAMGKAIIASDLDQIGHVFHNSLKADKLPDQPPQETESRIAILIQPGDVQQLVEAIRFIAVEPAWRVKLGMNARAEALAKYTWGHHVQEILARARSLNLIHDKQERSLSPLGATE